MEKELSIIIPHKNIPDLVIRCMRSIPDRPEIEVFVCDDCSNEDARNAVKCYVATRTNVTYLQSEEPLGAGHARNLGLRKATGKWLLFADADDFYTQDMWQLYLQWKDSDNEIIFFKVTGVDSDTLQPVRRGFNYNQYIDDFINGRKRASDRIRYYYMVPWGKLILRKLVTDNNIEFEEIIASNDVMFSTWTAEKAEKIAVCDKVLYTVTSRSNSLVKLKSKEVLRCRFKTYVKQNKFLCSRGKYRYVIDMMRPMNNAFRRFGFKEFCWYLNYALKNGANPLISIVKLFS